LPKMKNETFFNYLINGSVVVVLALAMFVKHSNDNRFDPKPYGELQAAPKTNEIMAALPQSSFEKLDFKSEEPIDAFDDLVDNKNNMVLFK
jgi:hypothetical protein